MTDPVRDDVAAYDPEEFVTDAATLATIAEFAALGLGPRAARTHVANAAEHIFPDGAARS